MRPREMDGSFMKDFDPLKGWKGFQEGNAAQYTWYVPHDIQGLINLMGIDLFNERLEKTFIESRKTQFGGEKRLIVFPVSRNCIIKEINPACMMPGYSTIPANRG